MGLLVALLVGLLAVCSCSKKEPAGQGQAPAQSGAVPATRIQPSGEARPAAAGDWAPLPITLPKPMFVGTPANLDGVTDLEPPLGKARPVPLAPKGVVNVALGKPVKSSSGEPIMGQLSLITDGDKEATDKSLVELDPFLQHVTVDLGGPHEIYGVLVWHYHKQSRAYVDVVVQVADDADFISQVRTLFNNDRDNSSGLGVGADRPYVETAEGKLIDAKGTVARYVRLYSRGNNANDQNHYLEVEVFGKPVP
ncbi:MAG: hypothetical protein KBE04_06690 [Phycisphaerae bacterium]|nr:hypothetical protein [Phycisphaerae bacterium]